MVAFRNKTTSVRISTNFNHATNGISRSEIPAPTAMDTFGFYNIHYPTIFFSSWDCSLLFNHGDYKPLSK